MPHALIKETDVDIAKLRSLAEISRISNEMADESTPA